MPAGSVQPPSGKNGPHVFVASLDMPDLASEDEHHLRRVLRTRPGGPITVGDGQGRWRPAILTDDGGEATGAILEVPAPPTQLSVAFALTKAHKPEFAVQKLTEIGIDRIIPFVAERSVVRWNPDRAEKNHARLTKVVREASMQSRRVRLPTLDRVRSFDELRTLLDADPALLQGAVLADMDGPTLTERHHMVLIGPEGGWSNAERGTLPTVGLGSHVLRAETASIVAGTLLLDRHRPSRSRGAILPKIT